jgi:hypothetical protein
MSDVNTTRPLHCDHWSTGLKGGAVVAEHVQRMSDQASDVTYYGGFLVCESVQSLERREQIALLPDIARALRELLLEPMSGATINRLGALARQLNPDLDVVQASGEPVEPRR